MSLYSLLGRPAGMPILLAAALFMAPSPSPADDPPAAKAPGDRLLHRVSRGDLTRTIVERGVLEAVNVEDVLCRVPGPTTIRWVIEDGTSVRKGDKLVELDDGLARDRFRKQEVVVAEKETVLAQAELALKLAQTVSQNEVESTEAAIEIGEAEIKKQQETKARHKRKLEIKLRQAQAALELARLQPGKTDAQVRAAVAIAEGDVDLADLDLKDFLADLPIEKRKREAALGQARTALEMTKIQAAGRRMQAEAQVRATKAVLDTEKVRLRELRDILARCVLTSPSDGLAIYEVPEQTRFGSGAGMSIVAVGEPVREGQRLMRVADLSRMQVRTRVHESVVSQVRPDGDGPAAPQGQQAQVRVDAFPGLLLRSHVRSVAPVASQQDWLSADVKVYPVVVSIDQAAAGLKPGMSAEVTVLVDQRKDVLLVPLQAILREKRETYCLVMAGDRVEKRKVVLGPSNDRAVEIRDGLKEGELVVLNPRAQQPGKPQSRLPAKVDVVVQSVAPKEEAGPRRTRLDSYGLTPADLERIRTLDSVTRAIPQRMFEQEVRRLAQKHPARIVGTTPEYADVAGLELEAGRLLTAEDEYEVKNVAVLGSAVARALFRAENALGQTVQIGSYFWLVVGVLKDRAAQADLGSNSDVYVPLGTCQARFGERVLVRKAGSFRPEAAPLLSRILLSVREPGQVRPTADAVADLLQQHHRNKDWDVQMPGRTSP